jgi:hypothetical protein
MTIARAKYGNVDVRFLIDHSSNHFAMAPDGLNAYAMNKSDDTSTQPHMRDTVYVGADGRQRTQKIGKRGVASVLRERGLDTQGKSLDELREVMARQPDFAAQQSRIEELATRHGMSILRGVKFHPELMPIEQLNGAMKRVVRKELNGSVQGLAERCIEALLSLDADLPMRFSRKSFVTLEAYQTGDWRRLDAVLTERKRRRRGLDGSQAPSVQSYSDDGDVAPSEQLPEAPPVGRALQALDDADSQAENDDDDAELALDEADDAVD